MTTKIDYFGDFISSIIISEDRYKYLENAGVEILSCVEYKDGKQKLDEKQFDITFKVNNITFLNFMHAGIKYSMEKYYKP
jgi:c-di-AMP phosphodiesterase-like protein